MFTAEEARKIAKSYTSPEKILKSIEKHIKTASSNGTFRIMYDCKTEDRELITLVATKLREVGYQVMTMPGSIIFIHW